MKHSARNISFRPLALAARSAALALLTVGVTSFLPGAAGTTPTLAISQVPLTITLPANPQVLFAVGNSESMDGNLSGAIMTGSGSLGTGYTQLNGSSSPVSFPIPAGFTPPVDPGDGVNAPYTSTVSGNRVDNSPSRLNVAKAGIQSVLNTYIQSADFGLIDYSTGSPGRYTTWVYYMSPAGSGFTFTNTPTAYTNVQTPYTIPNPCYQYATGTSVTSSCDALKGYYAAQNVSGSQYMLIGSSSDDPAINDVLYAGGIPPACVVYGGPNPANPYPPNYSLANYNTGSVGEGYSSGTPGGCATFTGPTNAGFVPYAQETFYAQRGFGYYSGQSATTGNVAVPMTSAGATPTAASVSAALGAFSPLLAPETDSTSTREIKAVAVQAPTAGLIAGALAYYNTNPPSSNGCTPKRYVVLVTDGLPTLDLAGRNWPPLGSAAATGYGVTATFNADGTVAATNDQALTDTIANITALKTAGIKTYVIGLGAGVDPSKNPIAAATLKAMAVAGGTGNYFPATSAASLTADMQVILAAILAQTQSTSSAAVNSTGLRTGSVVYQSQFVTSDSNLDWTGELYAFPIDPTTGAVSTLPASAAWSAAAKLDALNPVNRVIATWDPGLKKGIPFEWNNSLLPNGIYSATTLGTPIGSSDLLNFLRGNNSKEVRFGGTYRNRTHKLGDIVDSSPLYIGAPAGPSRTASYVAFAAAAASRPAMLYVGADDGMLHGFDATTGIERFAYVPNGVWANLAKLANPYYNQQHLFFVNGSPQASDVQFADLSWHTVLVANERAGGQSVFALDVSRPESLTTEALLSNAVLWEFSEADMGLTFSQPAIASTNAGYAAIFGNGYNSASGKPFLYAVNAQTGAQLAKIDLCAKVPTACNAALANGLSTVTAVNSSGGLAQPVDLVYAGDLQGNLWKINVSDPTPSNWTVTVLLQARDAGGNPQPITTAPAVSLNARYPSLLGTMVFVGTGQMLATGDLSSTQTQSIYGVYDPPAGYTAPLTRAKLVAQTLTTGTITTTSGGTQTVRFVSSNPVALPAQNGWYIDLNLLTGERAITDPRIESGGALVLTTYQPNSNTCSGGGAAYLMILNYASGSSFPTPQFDANGDSKITAADTATNGSNPVGMALGNVYAAAPVIRSAAFETASAVKLITESNGTIKTVIEKGSTQNRISWWEVQ